MNEGQKYCEFCGQDHKGIFYSRGSNYTVLKCSECSLLWSDPLTDDDYEKQINSDYFGEDIYLSKEKNQKERFRDQINKVLKMLEPSVEKDKIKILDIGSGLGFFLDVCDEEGIYCEGCDINEKAVQYANRNRVKTRLGTADAYYEDNSFDIIFALNLIEHIPHPKEFITQCRRILKPGGLLVLETPIQESLFHIIARAGDYLTGFKMNNYGINTNGHIYKFCGKTFEKIAGSGFEIIHKQKIGSPLKEIMGKTTYMSFKNRIVLKAVLPVAWLTARVLNLENRIFIVMKTVK
ncbi:MAG TPA: class I SAM-dependent methyltransferase [Clostridiales bacterium]|nr:class I SAM-dependent methyltransferase [Clostridiales bacterium]HQP69748.1 class I SAM-dependent methyltransferase [Clostridiales bacterium]